MTRITFIIAVSAVFLLSPPNLSFAENLKFASIKELIEQKIGAIILRQVYAGIGYNIEIKPFPAKRAQTAAKVGAVDGEIMRIYEYGVQTQNVVRVPTPYYQLETTAFVRKGTGVNISDKGDLANYSVAKVSGVKHTDLITEGLPDVSDVNSSRQLFAMLKRQRFDVVLTNTVDGLKVLKDAEIEGVEAISPPLATLKLYHYIHKSKAHLVSIVNQELLRLQASGELANMKKGAEKEIIGE